MKDGKGEYRWSNGNRYNGDYYKDKPHGSGTYRTVRGDNYEGEFANGLFQVEIQLVQFQSNFGPNFVRFRPNFGQNSFRFRPKYGQITKCLISKRARPFRSEFSPIFVYVVSSNFGQISVIFGFLSGFRDALEMQ